MIPVPALRAFCTGACLCAVVNFVMMLTMFMCVLVFEVLRIQANLPEPSCPCCQVGLCCCCCPSWCPCSPVEQHSAGSARGLEARFAQAIAERYAPFLDKRPVNVGMAFLVLALLALSGISIANKEVGYKPHWLAARGTPLHRGLEVYFDSFTIFSSTLVFGDVDVPARQQDMLEFYEKVTSRPFTLPGALPPYIQMLHWAMQAQGHENLTVGQRFTDGLENRDEWYRKYHEWASWPANASAAMTRLAAGDSTYILSDLARVNEFNYETASEPSLARLRMSHAPFLVARLAKPSDYVDCVEDMRNLLDNSVFEGTEAFAYGAVFTYWEAFIALEGTLLKIFLIDVGVIFIASLTCLRSVAAAFITTIMCLAIVAEVYGICMQILPFNIFMASVLLASAGIAVEDVAHSIAHFITKDGSVQHRLADSMNATFPAIIQGSVSTILSIAPMAFHPVPFYLVYYFVPFLLISVVGLFNGLICTPALLALMGWISQSCSTIMNDVFV